MLADWNGNDWNAVVSPAKNESGLNGLERKRLERGRPARNKRKRIKRIETEYQAPPPNPLPASEAGEFTDAGGLKRNAWNAVFSPAINEHGLNGFELKKRTRIGADYAGSTAYQHETNHEAYE